MLQTHVKCLVDSWMEIGIERFYLVAPWKFPFGNTVEFLFDLSGEIIIEDVGEIIGKESINYLAYIGRHEFAAFGTYNLASDLRCDLATCKGQHRVIARHPLFFPLLHIFTLLDGGYGGCIGRRAPYPQFLHLLYKGGFGVARRLLCVTLRGFHIGKRQHITLAHCRKQTLQRFVGGSIVILILHIDFQEAIEFDYLACCGKMPRQCALHPLGFYIDGGLFNLGISHLRCHGTLPYKRIQAFFLRRTVDSVVVYVCGAYGFVSLLRTF